MQEYGGGGPSKPGEYRDSTDGCRERGHPSQQEGAASNYQQHQFAMMQKVYGCSNKDLTEQTVATYCRVVSGIYEAAANQQYQNPRYTNSNAPTFSSPPNSPLVGLVFDPSSPNYSGPGMMGDRGLNPDRRSQSSWSISNQEPIGTGAKKKIVKSHDKRAYASDARYHHERYKDMAAENERHMKRDRNLMSESTSSLDFFVEGERMVSELCNIPDSSSRGDANAPKLNHKNSNQEEDKNKPGSSEVLLTALDKILIHDQIPNQIVQLAIEACTDAENIAIAHHNRPCFKNIHSICAKTRSNVQKPDSAVANLHSQGIPWVIKNFIFSFVRILDGWKGVKELLSEKHDTFSRIENKYYSPNIRECFVQWQAVTKEMLTHIYKTFKCLDHGFTMEQKSFTHNYYATNSAAPRHQQKFQPPKAHAGTPRTINASPQPYNSVQPPWAQSQAQSSSQSYHDGPWPTRSGVQCKKYPVVPPQSSHNFYPLNEPSDLDNYQKAQYKCDPCSIRESKPRQSWTITNVPDFRALESMCPADQRELYNQLKHKMDAELGKAPGQPLLGNMPCDLLQRREMELKAKMIPLSHVEKSLIPSMTAAAADMRGCYVQKNNSCGDTKEENDFFATWGQMVQNEPNDFLTHHAHNVQIPSNIVTHSNNISGPVQFVDPENDEFHEMSKVYMKPGSYKVPIKPADSLSPFLQGASQDNPYENPGDDSGPLKIKVPFPSVTLAPQPKYNLESWPCMMSRRTEDVYGDEKIMPRHAMPCLDMRGADPLELLSSMTSDRAWEAAKQSAPKLMDFLHDGPMKSDTARLYDALGLTANDDFVEELRQMKLFENNNIGWPPEMPANRFAPKEVPNLWDQQPSTKHEILLPQVHDQSAFNEDNSKFLESSAKTSEKFDQNTNSDSKTEESKENVRYLNYDQTGNSIRDDTQKKSSAKSKVASSGMWYHPKKKKPLPTSTVKKFEAVLTNLSQIQEAKFVLHDMDIKMAPRFYEVIKYPMCLHDISTKLQNSSYTDYEQVVQDFKRIFNNVKLYLKSYPDPVMKKNIQKVASEFEKTLADEFQHKPELKPRTQENETEFKENFEKKEDKNEIRFKTEINMDDSSKNTDSKKSDEKK